MAYSEKLIDKRTVQRYLDNGQVDRKQFQDYLSKLPDVSGNMQVMECVQDEEPEVQDDAPLGDDTYIEGE